MDTPAGSSDARTTSTDALPENTVMWNSFVVSAGERGDTSTSTNAFMLHLRQLLHAPTLDVDIVSHCNLNCAACCHFSPAAEPSYLALDSYRRDLEKLARIEGVGQYFEAICLMGGEPLLHPELPAFIRTTHEILPQAQVRVVTNGLLLRSMPQEFWDAMVMPKTDLLITPYPIGFDYVALAEHAASRGVDATLGGGFSASDEQGGFFLRTPLDETGSQDPNESFSACPLGGSTMQLLDGCIYPCNRGALLGIVNARFGTAFTHEENDRLELDRIGSVEEIDRFRRSARPMCRYCVSAIAERIDWRRSDVDRYEWLMRPDERGGGLGSSASNAENDRHYVPAPPVAEL